MSGMEKWEHLQISFAQIKDATNNFGKTIGKGGFGWVYKGKLFIDGRYIKVAVKMLNKKFGQGLKEFLTEIQLLSGEHHDNIITFVGYCDEGNEKIIVYEYAKRGSLDQYIRPSHRNYTLTWLERLKIVADAARGLDHLHNHVREHQTIIHRDIKSSNILLDHNWVAKISDFGLSKSTFSGVGASTVISDACGTPPYVDPEYIETRFVTKKSDVFSFGMVLFEVLCGRLSLVKDADGILLSADLAKEYYVNGKLDSIIDPVLREQMSPESFKNYSAIAYKCLQDRKHRPLMGVVKKELEVTLKLQKSFNARFNIQDDAPGSSSGCVKRNSNDDDVQITVDQNRHVLEESKLDNSPKPVGRLDRKKADATHAFKGLELNNQNNDSAAVWAVFETRFDKLTKFTNGLLPRSLFGECIGINKDSKEFAGKLFDSLSRQRNITVGAISKAQLKDFWDQIADQSYVSRVDNDVDQRITEDQVREIISISASINRLSNFKNQVDEYAALIMEELDPGNLGYIMIEDLEMLLVQGGRDEVIKERQNLSTNLSQPLKMTHHRSPMRRWYEDLKNRKFK